jgi:pilus assembly protein Flp/PilA
MGFWNRGKLLFIGIIIAIYTKERRVEPMKKLLSFFRDEAGASAVEYGLLVALIAAVIVGAVTLLGGNLKATFEYIAGIVLKP